MSRTLIPLASLLATAYAHGYVKNIVVNGVYYSGWEINSFPYMEDPPVVAAWGIPNSNGPIDISNGYDTEDIICNLNATNAAGYVEVAAGDSINLAWSPWPDTHHGPVIDYLASCGDSCTTVDKTTLEFFKIDGVGLIDDSPVPGTWADDQLIDNNNSWMVQIPSNIAPGNYVLRHEIIALHTAGTAGGAQNFPQCFNLKITGSGTESPSGTLGTKLYTEDDPGLLVNIYSSLASYDIPGPSMIAGATNVAQKTSAITATGSATAGSGGAAATGSAAASTTAASVTTTAAAKTALAKVSVSVPSSSSAAPTTLQPATRPSTSSDAPTVPAVTSAPSSPSASSGAGSSGTAGVYGQCGGSNFKGSATCPEGTTCHKYNPYYSQCIPA